MIVAGMLIIGGLLLAYALFHSSAKSKIPGWVPVNESLKTAIDNLDSAQQQASKSALSHGPSVTQSTVQEPTATEVSRTIGEKDPAGESAAANSSVGTTILDLNNATQSQLESLPGIGPAKAQAIISYREQNKGFRTVEQLLEVKGIGPKMLDRISELVHISLPK